jgi:hypothetical protein
MALKVMEDVVVTALISATDTAITNCLAVIATLKALRTDASVTNTVLDTQTAALTAVKASVDGLASTSSSIRGHGNT